MIEDIKIKENDYITLGDKGLLYTNKDVLKSIVGAYEKIKDDKDSIVTIYYGSDVTEADAMKVKEELESRYKNLEVTVYQGGQPVYYYYISVE